MSIPLLERHFTSEKFCWGKGSICEVLFCLWFLSWETSNLGQTGTTGTFGGDRVLKAQTESIRYKHKECD